MSRKTRIIDVVYNASNNELVRTKTLVKSAIVSIDATPFRQWYEAHYAKPLGRKKNVKLVWYIFLQILQGYLGYSGVEKKCVQAQAEGFLNFFNPSPVSGLPSPNL